MDVGGGAHAGWVWLLGKGGGGSRRKGMIGEREKDRDGDDGS